jgi:hypothetical protein
MGKQEIVKMDVIMVEIAKSKENVEKTIKDWMNVLDELNRRATEYANLSKNIKDRKGEFKRM